MTTAPLPRVAFVGLGTMGRPMAANLARAGFPLLLATKTPGKAAAVARELSADGRDVRAAATAAEAACGAAVIVSCVPDAPEVEEVHLGGGGTAEGAAAGAVVIDCSTIDAARARAIAAGLGAKGIAFLDAPVSGGQKGAVEGTLTFFIGGDAAALAKARPVFEAMGKRLTHLGPSGAGQLGKATNQILVANNLMAVAEALAFGAKAGLPLGPLHDALVGPRGPRAEDDRPRLQARLRRQAPAEGPRDRPAERARRRRAAPGRRARPPAPRLARGRGPGRGRDAGAPDRLREARRRALRSGSDPESASNGGRMKRF